MKPYPYRYEVAKRTLHNLTNDLLILCGERMGPSGVSAQDVVDTTICNLRAYANMLEQARSGNVADVSLVFPHPILD